MKLGLIVLEEKIKIVKIFFYFAITFSSGIQVLTFIWTNLDSFYLKKLEWKKFEWILPNVLEKSCSFFTFLYQ